MRGFAIQQSLCCGLLSCFHGRRNYLYRVLGLFVMVEPEKSFPVTIVLIRSSMGRNHDSQMHTFKSLDRCQDGDTIINRTLQLCVCEFVNLAIK